MGDPTLPPESPATPPVKALPPAVQERVDAGFYCPGCGKPYTYLRDCTGTPTAPHPAIEVVPSAELIADPPNPTPAPASGE